MLKLFIVGVFARRGNVLETKVGSLWAESRVVAYNVVYGELSRISPEGEGSVSLLEISEESIRIVRSN